MKTEQLYTSSEYCCGCSACKNICPQGAIRMEADEYGFVFPCVDESLCVDCGLCQKACSFKNSSPGNEPLKVYAAKINSDEIKKSSSGGIFAAIAKSVINNGGTVYGAAFTDGFTVKHVRAKNTEELMPILGSKYVQSDISNSYMLAKDDLENGKSVLFSGTPCQIDGLYGFLQKKYENLYTADIICHGVPSAKMFSDYLKSLESKSKIRDFVFRSKDIGGEMTSKILYENGKEKYLPRSASPYSYLYIKSYISRNSCYSCKYAGRRRIGDITLGDFWGIEQYHPEFDADGGVSCILINRENGKRVFETIAKDISFISSTAENAAANNAQLNHPIKKPEGRNTVLNAYKNEGYSAVEKQYRSISKGAKYISETKLIIKKVLRKAH